MNGFLALQRVQDFFGRESGAVAANLEKDSVNVVPLVREAYEVASFISLYFCFILYFQ